MKGIVQQMREVEIKVWDKLNIEDFKETLEKIIKTEEKINNGKIRK